MVAVCQLARCYSELVREVAETLRERERERERERLIEIVCEVDCMVLFWGGLLLIWSASEGACLSSISTPPLPHVHRPHPKCTHSSSLQNTYGSDSGGGGGSFEPALGAGLDLVKRDTQLFGVLEEELTASRCEDIAAGNK